MKKQNASIIGAKSWLTTVSVLIQMSRFSLSKMFDLCWPILKQDQDTLIEQSVHNTNVWC